jgi:hypothetical protein
MMIAISCGQYRYIASLGAEDSSLWAAELKPHPSATSFLQNASSRRSPGRAKPIFPQL